MKQAPFDCNQISKFEFAEVINEIADQTGEDVDSATIERMARELNSGDNMVTYGMLVEIFQDRLGVQIHENRDLRSESTNNEKIAWYLAEFISDEQIDLEIVIQLPVSRFDSFVEAISYRLKLL